LQATWSLKTSPCHDLPDPSKAGLAPPDQYDLFYNVSPLLQLILPMMESSDRAGGFLKPGG
jgi:hypothetical protein